MFVSLSECKTLLNVAQNQPPNGSGQQPLCKAPPGIKRFAQNRKKGTVDEKNHDTRPHKEGGTPALRERPAQLSDKPRFRYSVTSGLS